MNERRVAMVVFVFAIASVGQYIVAAEQFGPVSMSAEEFSRLSTADQRGLLVAVFQQRLAHAKNLEYKIDQQLKIFESHDGKRGKLKDEGPFRQCRQVRLGNSYRLDSTMYRAGEDHASQLVASHFDAEEGVLRGTTRGPRSEKSFGRINTGHDPLSRDYDYQYWLDGDFPRRDKFLFPYLLDHQDEFWVEAPIKGGMV